MNDKEIRLKEMENMKIPLSGGRNQLLRYLKGGRLTQRQMIHAKCCDCMGYYIDGKYSCEMPDCPLFEHMPYKNKIAPPVEG